MADKKPAPKLGAGHASGMGFGPIGSEGRLLSRIKCRTANPLRHLRDQDARQGAART